MHERLKQLGMINTVNLLAMALMLSSVLSGYVKVMASDDAEQKYQETAQLINAAAQGRVSTAQAQWS